MREIEFRGKSSTSGEWLYGSLIKINGHYHIISNNDFEEDGHHLHQISDIPTWVNEDTIGEFTGMYDNSHNKIYEGDYVKIYVWETKITYQGIVKLFDGCWMVESDWDIDGKEYHTLMFERAAELYTNVIGNIHDNKELLTINDNGK